MDRRTLAATLVCTVAGCVLFVAAQRLNIRTGAYDGQIEPNVALPIWVQLAAAGGDRYLAANIGAFRAMVSGTHKMPKESYLVLARVHEDVAWLNPGHEDNFYVAEAILPWQGHVGATQRILAAATDARRRDELPPFFYGFNRMHFYRDYVGAATSLKLAAARAPNESNRIALERIAARWVELGDDPKVAVSMIRSLEQNTRNTDLKRMLAQRIERLEGLIALRRAAGEYRSRFGRPPARLDDLVGAGLVGKIPPDPLGAGYRLDEAGEPQLK